MSIPDKGSNIDSGSFPITHMQLILCCVILVLVRDMDAAILFSFHNWWTLVTLQREVADSKLGIVHVIISVC